MKKNNKFLRVYLLNKNTGCVFCMTDRAELINQREKEIEVVDVLVTGEVKRKIFNRELYEISAIQAV